MLSPGYVTKAGLSQIKHFAGLESGATSVSIALNAPAPGTLTVTPATGLLATGNVGGPFSPVNCIYTLQNTGSSTMTWSAGKTKRWVTLSSTGGSLAIGASSSVTVWINPLANNLLEGGYTDTVSFTNTSNGLGNTSRAVILSLIRQNAVRSWLDYQ